MSSAGVRGHIVHVHDPPRAGHVEVVRELDAPPREAWRAWSDPELVRRWLATDQDPGGATIYVMDQSTDQTAP